MLILMMTLALATGQGEASTAPTRAEEMQQAREYKAQHLAPPDRGFLENALSEFKDRRVMERFQEGFHGFHPALGSLSKGSGFALGSVYTQGPFKAKGQASFTGYKKFEVSIERPSSEFSRYFATMDAAYKDSPREAYFGTGAGSQEHDRSAYRLESYSLGVQFGVRKGDVKVGAQLGWITGKAETGTDPRHPAISDVFDVTTLAAFGDSTDYIRSAAFVEMDSRDSAGNPRDGGKYSATWAVYESPTGGGHDFDQLDLEVQQYLPFFNQRRVIALRSKATLTHSATGQDIPFYMLPTLGGSEDLRGFDDFRFRDKNAVSMTAEYRWEAFSGLDLALFADAGQVMSDVRDFKLTEMKTAAGFGFRFNTAQKVFWRVDVGFSEEGTRIFMKFGHVF